MDLRPGLHQLRRLMRFHCRSLIDIQEGQEFGVDLILMCRRDAVRRARIVDFLCALDEPSGFLRRVL